MLSVPEPVINQTQGKLFAFLWRNKKDRIKRQALYQPLAKGGLSFPCFRTAVKALRLSWIGKILSNSNDNWKAIPNHYLMTLNTWITDFLAFTVSFSGFFMNHV